MPKKPIIPGQTSLRGRKKRMYEAMKSQLGVVTPSAKLAGIDRTTHYKWMNEDPNYKAWIEELDELTLDFAENQLLKKMKKGDTRAIIFYLKTKGKSRGFVEKQEIDINSENTSLTKEEIQAEIKRLLGK